MVYEYHFEKMLKWQPELVFYSKRANYRDIMRKMFS
jgi:hypothetical protein